MWHSPAHSPINQSHNDADVFVRRRIRPREESHYNDQSHSHSDTPSLNPSPYSTPITSPLTPNNATNRFDWTFDGQKWFFAFLPPSSSSPSHLIVDELDLHRSNKRVKFEYETTLDHQLERSFSRCSIDAAEVHNSVQNSTESHATPPLGRTFVRAKRAVHSAGASPDMSPLPRSPNTQRSTPNSPLNINRIPRASLWQLQQRRPRLMTKEERAALFPALPSQTPVSSPTLNPIKGKLGKRSMEESMEDEQTVAQGSKRVKPGVDDGFIAVFDDADSPQKPAHSRQIGSLVDFVEPCAFPPASPFKHGASQSANNPPASKRSIIEELNRAVRSVSLTETSANNHSLDQSLDFDLPSPPCLMFRSVQQNHALNHSLDRSIDTVWSDDDDESVDESSRQSSTHSTPESTTRRLEINQLSEFLQSISRPNNQSIMQTIDQTVTQTTEASPPVNQSKLARRARPSLNECLITQGQANDAANNQSISVPPCSPILRRARSLGHESMQSFHHTSSTQASNQQLNFSNNLLLDDLYVTPVTRFASQSLPLRSTVQSTNPSSNSYTNNPFYVPIVNS